jgi:hypothetical protein
MVSSSAKSAFGAALALIAVALAIDSGVVGWMVAPLVLTLVFYAISQVPLRTSLLVLMFCAFVLENPSEQPAVGMWKSPWAPMGALMLQHLKNTVGGGLFFSGMDVMLVALGIVAFSRRARSAKLDRQGNFKTPKPMLKLAYLSLGGAAFVWLVGIIRGGGDNSMAVWQLDRVIYVPVVFLLFQAGVRGPRDVPAVAKVILAAGMWRALQACYVRATIVVPPDPNTGESGLPYATTHNDSMLFAWATVLVVSLLIHRVRGAGKVAALAGPVLVAGMLANTRRMVWVESLLVLATLYLMTAMNPIKRKIQNALKLSSPLILLYVMIGWSSNSKIFKPVKIIRSAVDSKADASTQWRDLENFNLLMTFKQNPFFGTGYGHGFKEIVALPPVDYSLEHYVPHNSIAGLWAYCGYFGYTMMTALWVAGVYFGIRAYHSATAAADKAAALVSFGAILIYYLQCYGDMGLGSWTGVFMVAPSLAMAGKLCVANGGWEGAPNRVASPAVARPVGASVPPARA